MELNFKNYFETNTIGYHNDGPGSNFYPFGGSYLTSDQTGSETGMSLPSIDFSIIAPTVERKSKIYHIEFNKNPITIILQDGTKLFFNLDEFKRIQGGKPEAGKTMSVVFQRSPLDNSVNPSKLVSCRVL